MKRFTCVALAALFTIALMPALSFAQDVAKLTTLKATKFLLLAEAGKAGKLTATLTSEGKTWGLAADGIHLKLGAGGIIVVEALNAVLAEIKAPVVGAPVKVEGGWRFSFSNDAAKAALGKDPGTVNLAGEFNGWNSGDANYALKLADGVWSITVPLQPGKYQYKFVLDGGAKWKEDPSNTETMDDHNGGLNTIVTVP